MFQITEYFGMFQWTDDYGRFKGLGFIQFEFA